MFTANNTHGLVSQTCGVPERADCQELRGRDGMGGVGTL